MTSPTNFSSRLEDGYDYEPIPNSPLPRGEKGEKIETVN
jgi:hypothetical protein